MQAHVYTGCVDSLAVSDGVIILHNLKSWRKCVLAGIQVPAPYSRLGDYFRGVDVNIFILGRNR